MTNATEEKKEKEKKMAESICRALRDGALDGELAPALTIKDSIHSGFGSDVFNYVLSQLASNILAGKSQARGLVLVGFNRSASFYADLLKSIGIDFVSSDKWIRIVDCYCDPLGWKDKLLGFSSNNNLSLGDTVTLCKDVRDLEKLLSLILEVGIGLVAHGKSRFSIALDSVTEMLRHTSLHSLASLISNLRSHGQVSSIFWLIHSDLHETRVTAALEYMSSIVASLEPITHSVNEQKGDQENPFGLKQNRRKGKFYVRFKRRNGRVRVTCEEFNSEKADIKFIPVSSGSGIVNQTLVPKFYLQLSERERIDREKVVLPFEHQGNGKDVQIYDGRRSATEIQNGMRPVSTNKLQMEGSSSKGEIHYIRDSDDEQPDSDEDPDDDLDI